MLETQSEKFLEFNLNHNETKQIVGTDMDLNSESGSGSDCDTDHAKSHHSEATGKTHAATEQDIEADSHNVSPEMSS